MPINPINPPPEDWIPAINELYNNMNISQEAALNSLDEIINTYPFNYPVPTHAQFKDHWNYYFDTQYETPLNIHAHILSIPADITEEEKYATFWAILNRAYATPYEMAGQGAVGTSGITMSQNGTYQRVSPRMVSGKGQTSAYGTISSEFGRIMF
jgi:hypothetical protein